MSLQDQLVKAGLVNKQQAKQARAAKRKKRKQGGTDDNKILSQQVLEQRQQQAEKDKQLNLEKYENELQLGRIRALRTELPKAAIKLDENAELEYNYTFAGKVLKLYVNEEQRQGLANGALGIARVDDKSYVLPNKLVERVQKINPQWVAYIYDGDEQVSAVEDDPYADYQIPDDLMW
ncbi:DUF2058 family protein [Paraferrimonas sp. SM1919]|uniref:DUF2058 family protein n=1 Tax=Paraferrimonas sp. SM1919 TaxID=2662263 RepID=UPI0013D75F80|nr:DUF2058 family protein [Paraferrimonas sp. SM1919]